MKVLVDTSVWSLALRRNKLDPEKPSVTTLSNLIRESRVVMAGAIRQELLSGIKSKEQFERLRGKLGAFPDLPLGAEDFETAAEFYNLAGRKAYGGSNTDFLLCAIAHRRDIELLSTDKDFGAIQPTYKLQVVPAAELTSIS